MAAVATPYGEPLHGKSPHGIVDAFRASLKEFPQSTATGNAGAFNFGPAANFAPSETSSSKGSKSGGGKNANFFSAGGGEPPPLISDPKAPTAVMTVRVSRVPPRSGKRSKPMYPFAPLERKSVAYRGFPMDGGEHMKRTGKWRIQLVPPVVGQPTQTMPDFPDRGHLEVSSEGKLVSVSPQEPLTESQRVFNTGRGFAGGSKTSASYPPRAPAQQPYWPPSHQVDQSPLAPPGVRSRGVDGGERSSRYSPTHSETGESPQPSASVSNSRRSSRRHEERHSRGSRPSQRSPREERRSASQQKD